MLVTSEGNNVNADRNRSRVEFNPRLSFPANGNLRVHMSNASLPYTFCNLKTDATFKYRSALGGSTEGTNLFTVTIPAGIYDDTGLTEILSVALVRNGHAKDMIRLAPFSAIPKFMALINASGWQIEMPSNTDFCNLFGCTAGQLVPAAALTTGVYAEQLPNLSKIGDVLAINVHCPELDGFVRDGQQTTIIGTVPLDSPPQSVIQYRTPRVERIDNSQLDGQDLQVLSIELRDNLGNPILYTSNDKWNVTIVFEWD